MWWTPEKIAVAEAEAASWVGTPMMGDCCIKGPSGGVSCHLLVLDICRKTGAMPADLPNLKGSIRASPLQRQRRIIEWIEANACPPWEEAAWPCVAGDVVCLKGGHMVFVLQDGRIVHALGREGVAIDQMNDSPWLGRVLKIWRRTS